LRSALADRLSEEHIAFYADTGSYCRIGPYLLVHAGVRPGVPLESQSTADLLGIRREFLEFKGNLGFIVVHGHTPVLTPELRRNRINIDTGAFATNRLTCLRIGPSGARTMVA
jgi:serine/threonine protein phosphatase 1